MDNKIIIVMIALIVVVGIGGYFVGFIQGAGTISINMSNNSTGNDSNISSGSSNNPSTSTYETPVVTVTTAKNKTINNDVPTTKNDTPSTNNTK